VNAIVNSQQLAAELRLLNKVVPEKPSLPVLTHVLVRAEGGELGFFGTDMEVGFRTRCPADVHEQGAVTLPAQRLLALVEQLPDGDVQIQTSGPHVHVSSEAFKSRLQTFSVEDFPTAPEVGGECATLSTVALQTMIAKTRYAVTEKSRHVSNGSLLSLSEKFCAMVATDGKCLSISTMAPAVGAQSDTILPAKALDALTAMFTGEQLVFSKTDRHLFFASRERLLISRQLEGQFPAYEKIIPHDTNKHAVISRSRLASALRRVGVLAENNQAAYFAFSDGRLTVTSSSADAGDAAEDVPITYTGDPLKLCCNWKYVLDFLEAAAADSVTIECKSTTTPMLLSEGITFINVIMTMRG
jgi:DNA polymerase-3 subunit beta